MTVQQRISRMTTRHAAIDIELHERFPEAIDEIAGRAEAPMRFLRAAWYAAHASEGSTLVARRVDGTPYAAIPTAPVGPAMLGMRGVPGGYWPFRALPIARDATASELAAMLAHYAARQALSPLWRMGPAYADHPTTAKLLAAAKRAGWSVLKRPLGRSWILDLEAASRPGPWPRKSVARRLHISSRQLESLGPVSIANVHGAAWSPETLEEMGRIEATSWVGTDTDGSGAKFLTAEQRARWQAALADPVLAQALHATILRVGDRPVAYTFDMLVGDHQYGIASSYDPEFRSMGPGKFVTYRQFEDSVRRGIRRVDLGTGDSGYKRDMGAEPGSEIADYLFVRSKSAAAVLRMKWESGAGGEADAPPREIDWDDALIAAAARDGTPRDAIGNLEQILLAGMIAATSIALVE